MLLLAVPQLHRQDRRHQRERRRIGADQRPVADRKPIDEPKYNTEREYTGCRQRQSASLLFADHFDRLWQPAQRREHGTDAADEIDERAECHTSAIRLIRLLHMTILLPSRAASGGADNTFDPTQRDGPVVELSYVPNIRIRMNLLILLAGSICAGTLASHVASVLAVIARFKRRDAGTPHTASASAGVSILRPV